MKTQFKSIRVTQTLDRGVPLGEGGCVGVRLQVNQYGRNDNGGTIRDTVYYGDANAQEVELLAGEITKFIPCEDLSEIFVRASLADPNAPVILQVLIYK